MRTAVSGGLRVCPGSRGTVQQVTAELDHQMPSNAMRDVGEEEGDIADQQP